MFDALLDLLIVRAAESGKLLQTAILVSIGLFAAIGILAAPQLIIAGIRRFISPQDLETYKKIIGPNNSEISIVISLAID